MGVKKCSSNAIPVLKVALELRKGMKGKEIGIVVSGVRVTLPRLRIVVRYNGRVSHAIEYKSLVLRINTKMQADASVDGVEKNNGFDWSLFGMQVTCPAMRIVKIREKGKPFLCH